MDECLDQEQAVLYPPPPAHGEAGPGKAGSPAGDVLLSQAITHAHRELGASDARLKVVSLPLRENDRVIGVITVESTAEGPADIGSIERAQLNIAIWDGAWHPLSTPGPGGIEVISDWTKVVPSPDGGFVAFGDFNTMNGGLAASYAKWGCRTRCVADFNSSGAVSFEDFDAFVAALEAGTGTADINNDGFLTFEDFDAFVIAFEAGC